MKDIRNALWDELDQLDEDYASGKVELKDYTRFKQNLIASYESDVAEYKRNAEEVKD